MLQKVITHQVNPHRTNLAITVDRNEDSWEYRHLRDAGFSFFYKGNPFNKSTPELYKNPNLQISQMLLNKLHPKHEEFGPFVGKKLKALEWSEHAKQLWYDTNELLNKVRSIKKNDEKTILGIIDDWGIDLTDTPLKQHQLQSLALYITLGYSNNWGQMRTGKTPPTIVYCYHLYLKWLLSKGKEGVQTNLIVVPNSIKKIWLDEIGKFTNDITMSLSDVIEGTKDEKKALWSKPSIFKIANYECLRADFPIVKDAFRNRRYSLVLDESHNAKNPSKQTRCIQALVFGIPADEEDTDSERNQPKSFIALSGTPVANKPHDVVRVVSMTAPGLLGKSFDDFTQKYCYTNGGYIVGYRRDALDKIHNCMARVSVRALRADVNMELGKKFQYQAVEMTPEQEKVHNDLQDAYMAELMGWDGSNQAVFVNSLLTQMMKLQQITGGFLYDKNGMSRWLPDERNPKIKWLDGFIDEYLDDVEKLVIACKFRAVIHKLEDRYKKHGVTCIHGDIKAEERTRRMYEFQEDKNTKIMVIMASTAPGMDLNPKTLEKGKEEFMVFYTRDFYPLNNWQCEDRMTGFNQTGESLIMPIVAKNSIDTALEEVLALKQKWADATTGDKGKTTPDLVNADGLRITRDDLFKLLSRKNQKVTVQDWANNPAQVYKETKE